jgi:glycosyltransferase involved in cell wall biosynthesis
MNVCHLSSVHPTFDARIFHKECVHLARQGFDVTYVTPGEAPKWAEGVRIVTVPRPRELGRATRALGLARRIVRRAARARATLYHLHDPELLLHAGLLRATGARIVYDAHEDLPRQLLGKDYVPRLLRRPMSMAAEVIENRLLRQVDAMVTATPSILARFRGLGHRAVDVNNFPDPVAFALSEPSARHANTVCYVGAIGIHRGIVEMIEALRDQPTRLLLAGQFLDQSLEQRCRSMRGWSQVEFLGPLPHGDIPRVLAQASVGLCLLHGRSSYIESQPTKIFEYLLAGLPVVISDFKYWRRLFGDHPYIRYVDPRRPRQIAAAVGALLAARAEHAEWARRARASILSRYTWPTESEKLRQLYLELLNPRASLPH